MANLPRRQRSPAVLAESNPFTLRPACVAHTVPLSRGPSRLLETLTARPDRSASSIPSTRKLASTSPPTCVGSLRLVGGSIFGLRCVSGRCSWGGSVASGRAPSSVAAGTTLCEPRRAVLAAPLQVMHPGLELVHHPQIRVVPHHMRIRLVHAPASGWRASDRLSANHAAAHRSGSASAPRKRMPSPPSSPAAAAAPSAADPGDPDSAWQTAETAAPCLHRPIHARPLPRHLRPPAPPLRSRPASPTSPPSHPSSAPEIRSSIAAGGCGSWPRSISIHAAPRFASVSISRQEAHPTRCRSNAACSPAGRLPSTASASIPSKCVHTLASAVWPGLALPN